LQLDDFIEIVIKTFGQLDIEEEKHIIEKGVAIGFTEKEVSHRIDEILKKFNAKRVEKSYISNSKKNNFKIFISHAKEDKSLAQRLANELRECGIEVWIDHLGIRGGDSIPKRIGDALKWSTTLLLLWSSSANTSKWVHLEWENALVLNKVIIPCKLDNTKFPPILSNIFHLDFADIEKGIASLLNTLDIYYYSKK
jgi:hypothetical protein